MKSLFLILLCTGAFFSMYSQDKREYLTVFYVNSFRNDSIHVFLNGKLIEKLRLKTEPSTGACDELTVVKLSDRKQQLSFCEVANKRKFQTEIKEGFKYLYVYKVDGNYRFDFSNKFLRFE